MRKLNILIALATLFCCATASAQYSDYTINSQMYPASCVLGDTVIYEIQIANLGIDAYPPTSLLATISAPGDARIIGFTDDGAMAGWEIFNISQGTFANQGGTSVTLRNTVALGGGEVVYPSLKVVAVNLGTAIGNQTSEVIARNIFAGFGYLSDLDPNNNTSGTSLAVTAPLPVSFTNINAAWKNNDGIVNWTIVNETENAYFIIERSFDGKGFTNAGQVKSVGNHKDAYTYSFTDVDVKSKTTDKIFYRVKQVDINGKYGWSSVVSLSVAGNGAQAYIFPNPVKGNQLSFVYEDFNMEADVKLDIRIIDVQGRTLTATERSVAKGKNQIELSTETLAPGMYYLNYSGKDGAIKGALRFVKE